jgi:iron(III) transport system substrate-binding protein
MLIVDNRLRDKPVSIEAYADPRFNGKAVMANPLFGTTTAHMAALFAVWGDDRAKAFLDATRKNGVHISSSNGESADQVATGPFQFALVDSDDVHSRQKQGQLIDGVYPDQEEGGLGCFIVPNAVVLIKNRPHADVGRSSSTISFRERQRRSLPIQMPREIPCTEEVGTPPDVRRLDTLKTMKVDYAQVAAKMRRSNLSSRTGWDISLQRRLILLLVVFVLVVVGLLRWRRC